MERTGKHMWRRVSTDRVDFDDDHKTMKVKQSTDSAGVRCKAKGYDDG